MRCPNCGADVADSKKFCLQCGAKLVLPVPLTAKCSKCGTELAPGKKFCGVCGTPSASVDSRNSAAPPGNAPLSHARASGAPSGSASSAAPARALESRTPLPRTGLSRPPVAPRLPREPIKLPSPKTVALVCVGLVAVLAIAFWLYWGVELMLVTEPGGASVMLDGKIVGRTSESGGFLVVPHLSHGTHTVTLTHPGFDDWNEHVSLGWFHLSHPLKVLLPVPTFPLTVISIPSGAKVQIDGQDWGATDSSGTLVAAHIPRGRHVVTVSMSGYPTWSNAISLTDNTTVTADLQSMAAAVQQEIASRLSQARTLFQQRDYRSAITECDAVLRLDASNQEAANLKSQIQETMNILGVQ